MTFAMDYSNFFLLSLKKLVIYKNNNIHALLNSSFDTSIFFSQSGKLDRLFQLKNIEEDELALFTHKQEEIEVDTLNTNLEVEEEEQEIHSNLGF